MKTRDAVRLRLAAARHLFALYPVPATLERIWIDRLPAIEVDQQSRTVQVRGLANRLAHEDERNVIERWAKARGITLR